MAKKSSKKTDKNMAFQLEKQMRWELAQRRKRQKRNIIAVVICSVIVIGLVVTMAMTQIIIPMNKKEAAEASASASTSASTPAATPTPDELVTNDVPENAGKVEAPADPKGEPKYTPSDWKVDDGKIHVKVLEAGDGDLITQANTVNAYYTGWKAVDGKMFDGTAKHGGEASSFPLSGVIQGWTHGIANTHVGDKLAIYIPTEYAYQSETDLPSGQPGGPLVFYVNVISKS